MEDDGSEGSRHGESAEGNRSKVRPSNMGTSIGVSEVAAFCGRIPDAPPEMRCYSTLAGRDKPPGRCENRRIGNNDEERSRRFASDDRWQLALRTQRRLGMTKRLDHLSAQRPMPEPTDFGSIVLSVALALIAAAGVHLAIVIGRQRAKRRTVAILKASLVDDDEHAA